MLDHCIARVWKKKGGIAGTAFLVTEKHLLTCAHVVNFVFGKEKNHTDKPTDSFEVDFPFLGKSKIRVKVRKDLWYPLPLEPSSQSDIAVLEVQNELPLGCCAGNFAKANNFSGHIIRAFGFPANTGSEGRWLQAETLGPVTNRWIQAEARTELTGEQIRQGFSGAPVWSDSLGAIVGMITAYDTDSAQKRIGFFIPADLLLDALCDLKSYCILKSKAVTPPLAPKYLEYHLNYEKQWAAFRSSIENHQGQDSRRKRPLVCLLHGREGFGVGTGLIERLKMDLHAYYLVDIESPKHFNFADTTQDLYSALDNNLAEAFSNGPEEIKKIKSITHGTPYLLYTEVECTELNGKMLQDFLVYWDDWEDQSHLFLVCLFVYYPEQVLSARWCKFQLNVLWWLKKLAAKHYILPELGTISKKDVNDWALSPKVNKFFKEGGDKVVLNNLCDLFPSNKKQRMEILAPKLDELLAIITES